MSEEMRYVEEIAPLTEEQWNRIISWHRKRLGRESVQGLIAAKEFQASMEKIHQLAGHTQDAIEKPDLGA